MHTLKVMQCIPYKLVIEINEIMYAKPVTQYLVQFRSKPSTHDNFFPFSLKSHSIDLILIFPINI